MPESFPFDMGICCSAFRQQCYYKRICSVGKTYLEYACNADPVSQKKLVFLFHLR